MASGDAQAGVAAFSGLAEQDGVALSGVVWPGSTAGKQVPMPARKPTAVRQRRFPNPLRAVVNGTFEFAASLNPRREQSDLAKLAFYATLGGLAVGEIIQPEVAVLVGVGHMLASSRSRAAAEAGAAMEEST